MAATSWCLLFQAERCAGLCRPLSWEAVAGWRSDGVVARARARRAAWVGRAAASMAAPSVNKTPASGSQRGQSHAPFQRLAAGGVGWPRSAPSLSVVRLSKCYDISGASGIRANPQNGWCRGLFVLRCIRWSTLASASRRNAAPRPALACSLGQNCDLAPCGPGS
jgi:hypothetical protein